VTAIHRTIQCLEREVTELEAESSHFADRVAELEGQVAALTLERDELRAGFDVLMAEHERRAQKLREIEGLRCAHPACQLCQMEG